MTLRRVTLFILIIALLLGCAALPAGAEHKHTWKDLPDGVIQQPTCTDNGWKIQYCTGCGITKDVKIPALGHSFTTKTYKSYADCEHYGIFYWTCSRCGYKSEGNDRPLGHDWDEGVITTMPQGFTPGVKTYTCKRDPSHTYTEEVDPIDWLFVTLEGINDPDFSGKVKTLDLPPLVIVKQPEGGYVDQDSDEGLVLTVEADGGEPPYTYEWYRTAQDEETLEKAKEIVAAFYAILGMSEEAIKAELDQYTLESLSVLEGEEQEFHATQGGYGYYCVVTDSVKQTATSDIAKTKSTISIWTNPSNANLMGKDSVTLACTATGGSGEYGFSWYKVSEDVEDTWEGFGTTDDEGFNAGKHNEIEIDECGEYYCEAEDLVTHHTATSRVATVYAAPQLRIYVSETTLTRDPGAEVSLSAAIRGGVPPYDIHWECYGDEDPEYEIMSDEETTSTVAITHKAGMYTVYAEDEVGNYVWQTISRYDPDLTIAQQPVGGTMYSNDHEDISIAIADGEAPYHYTLYHNNKVYKEDTIDDAKATFEVEDPGVYYFRVEDSTGRGCTSATATFELPNIKVTILTPSAEIKRWGDPAYLEIAAEGGTEPYYYMWIRIGEDESWHHDANFNSSHYVAYEDGEYFCIVVDAENDSAYSDVMTVTYTGGEPVIIEQPQSHTSAERFPDGAFDVSLHCRATTPSGDYAGIKYVWEIYLPNIGWAQTTTTGEWFYPVEPGLYRCRVINTATGEYVYSKVAAVSEKLSLTVEPTGKGGLYSELGEYRYIISGGVAPYNLEITLVSKYPSPQEDGYVEMIDFEAPYIGYCGIPQFPAKGVIDLEIFRDFWYWNPYEGQTKYKWYYASYYMVLTDAAGSSVTSDLIDVIKDYRTGPD